MSHRRIGNYVFWHCFVEMSPQSKRAEDRTDERELAWCTPWCTEYCHRSFIRRFGLECFDGFRLENFVNRFC